MFSYILLIFVYPVTAIVKELAMTSRRVSEVYGLLETITPYSSVVLGQSLLSPFHCTLKSQGNL